jgi:NAD(P)H-dependent FMN reductase
MSSVLRERVALVVGAGGVQGLQAVNTMEFIARSLRGWSVPLVLPVAQSWQSFDPDGHLKDEAVASQLRKLGAEVVRAARHFVVAVSSIMTRNANDWGWHFRSGRLVVNAGQPAP